MKKKILAISILVLLIGFFTFNFVSVKADSGWDSDFDSGWDSDWGSDWDSGSDYGWSSGGGYSGGVSFIELLIFIIIIIIVIKNNKNNEGTNPRREQGNSRFDKSIDEKEIQEYIPNFNKDVFLTQAYNNFIAVQNAWSEFDYNALRKLLSDELYNTYHSQLVALKAKKQKNLMSDFDEKNIDITDFKVDDNNISIKVSLTVSFFDYVVDKEEKVVRGTKSFKLTNSYDLTFISTLKSQNSKKKKNCPSCGAPLDDTASNACTYCNSTIVFENHDWVLSKKEIRR